MSNSSSESIEAESVDALLEERIDGEIESVVWYRSRGDARYALVASLTEDGRAQLTTALLDVGDDTLRVLDNSMWLPAEGEILEAAIRSLARTCSAATGSVDGEPLRDSLLDFDADTIGSREIADDYDPSDHAADGNWKENEGAPEMDDVHARLEESPIENADRFIMLEWGRKEPWGGARSREMHPPEEIGGPYGVEVSEGDDLIILDVDDMDAAPLEALPDTLTSESPHGGIHLFYHVPGWLSTFRARFQDVENPHPAWGEIRSQDGYVVGPGCEITTCKHGCCTEDDPGRYELVEDVPIATLDSQDLADLLAASRGVTA